MNTNRIRASQFVSSGQRARRTTVRSRVGTAAVACALAAFAMSGASANASAFDVQSQPAVDLVVDIHVIPDAAEASASDDLSQPAVDLVADIHVIPDTTETSVSDVLSLPAVDLVVDIHVAPTIVEARLESDSIPMPWPRPILPTLTPVRSPAEQLGLAGKALAKAEDCLARAIYFEARGETVRGQIGVAQVIMNRVFSRYYPGKVCGVIYQNAHRRNACQFSFACDGKREVINDQRAWSLAQHIARLTLDGRIWDSEIAKATHYHAAWVNPRWASTMRKLARLGVHIFYRPPQWGDGSDEPDWSRVAARPVVAALE
jgi:hypothetical protein